MTPTPEPVTEDGLTTPLNFNDSHSRERRLTVLADFAEQHAGAPTVAIHNLSQLATDIRETLALAALNTETARSGELREEAVTLFRSFCRGLEAGHPNRWSSDDSEHAIAEFRAALSKTNNEVRG